MGRAALLFWLLPRHFRSSWVLLSVTFCGVLAAVTVMAIGGIYSRALAEGGLQHSLASSSRSVLNVRLTIQNRPLGLADYADLRAGIEGIIEDRVEFLVTGLQRHGRTQPDLPLVLNPEEGVSFLGGPRGRPFFLTGFQEHSQLVEGRWPEANPEVHENGVDVEAVVGQSAAKTLDLHVGDRVHVLPFRSVEDQRIEITIVGLAEPVDTQEEYWMGSPVYFALQNYGDNPLVSFYVNEATFFDGLGARYPSLVGDYEWFLFTDTTVLTVDTVQSTRDALTGLETDVNKGYPRSTVLTLLENSRGTGLLTTYQRDLTLARVPVFLFLSLVVMVVLYFLTVVVGLLARTRSDEASLLRSRGADLLQVGGLLVLAEGLMVVAAVVIGPFLALAVAKQFLLPTIVPLGMAGPVPVGLDWDMFVLSAIGGVLSLVVLGISTAGISRLGILEFLRARARPATVPFLQRYYVDLLVLAALGLLLWQVQGRGGFVGRAVSGTDLDLDPTLLLGPALALLAAAFVLMRVMPPLVRGLAWLSSLAAPSWAALTLAKVSRDPLSHSSLAVMIMLAAALGVFGSAFQSTLSRSQEEQALYRYGGDLVLSGVSFPASQREQRFRELTGIPGVVSISPVWRDSVRTVEASASPTMTLLAVQSATLPDAGWFREDFSPSAPDLSGLLTPLRAGAANLPSLSGYLPTGIPVPEEATAVGLWVNATELQAGTLTQAPNLWVRFRDVGGRHRTAQLGELALDIGDAKGWVFFEAELPDPIFMERPLSVVSVYVSAPAISRIPPGSIYLDDLTALPVAPGDPRNGVIEEFEDPGRWVPYPHKGDEPDRLSLAAAAARSGDYGMKFSWTDALANEARGVLVPPGPYPLPAIGGPGLQTGQVVRITAGRQLAPLVIAGQTEFFPTMTSSTRRFVIVALDEYNDYMRRVGGSAERPGEFWIALQEGTEREAVIQALRDTLPRNARLQDRALAVDAARRDPLAGGAWNGLTLLGIGALTLAVALALGTHAVVSVLTGRVDLTVTRALGFSRTQMFLSLVLEKAVVAVLGMVVGGIAGYWLSRWVIGFLDTTPAGRDIIPPVVFTSQGEIVLLSLGCLVVAAALAVILAAATTSRLRASDILRNIE